MFLFSLFFSSLTFFLNRLFFFISSPSLTFLEICQMFFYLDALINFSQNWLIFFCFLNVFFTALPH